MPALLILRCCCLKKTFSILRRVFGILLAAGLLALNYTPAFCNFRNLPDTICISEGQDFSLTTSGPFKIRTDEASLVALNAGETLQDVSALSEAATIEVSFLGFIPVKSIDVYVREESWVIPGGCAIGVSLHTQCPLVVGNGEIVTPSGTYISPAAASGVKPGDYIEAVNGHAIETAEQLISVELDDMPVELTLNRNGKRITAKIQPVLDCRDGEYRLGIWVRDSTMGIGTLSFCDSTLGWYGGLGHAIIDVDTNTILNVREGKIVEADIIDIIAGEEGLPGELRGTFYSGSAVYGNIQKNTVYGIYGNMEKPFVNKLYPSGIQLAYPEEAHEGEAVILSTLDDGEIHAFQCKVVKVNPQSSPEPKGLVIEVTDPFLLEKTGGIVQGMSGSPLIQDGKLLGAVTHVFVNDPAKGYCMYALWMKEQMR